jgi:hypothetical protein
MTRDTCRSLSPLVPCSHTPCIYQLLVGDRRLQPTSPMSFHALSCTTESILSSMYYCSSCESFEINSLDFSIPWLGLRISYQHELRTLASCGFSPLRQKARHRHVHSYCRGANRLRGILHFTRQSSQWESRFPQQHPHRCCNKYRASVDRLRPHAN